MTVHFEEAVRRLRAVGAKDVDSYERKLIQNTGDPIKVKDLLSEARVALMFAQHGAVVTMRDSPDLKVEWTQEFLYAEVKHFHEKEQDRIDDQAMQGAGNLYVPVGDTFQREGKHAWKQIADVAMRKKHQYQAGAVNILVIDSSSDSLMLMAPSAVNEFDELLLKTPSDAALRRLNGIMLITNWGSVSGGFRNVQFSPTRYPSVQMNRPLAQALQEIYCG